MTWTRLVHGHNVFCLHENHDQEDRPTETTSTADGYSQTTTQTDRIPTPQVTHTMGMEYVQASSEVINTRDAKLDTRSVSTTADGKNVEIVLDYLNNPTVSSTSLAHLLWRQVLRPGLDSAVDATCGNGGDSLFLAQVLFSPFQPYNGTSDKPSEYETTSSQLLCVDISPHACQATERALKAVYPNYLTTSNNQDKITVFCGSHSPLPVPTRGSCALVVYNLGYLPGENKSISTMTQTQSTISSLSCAALAIRIGGLISVMTYPRSNPEEDWAVRLFLEGLALFSSSTQNWRSWILSDQNCFTKQQCSNLTQVMVQKELERVQKTGGSKQKWRVHEHRKLGRNDSPILLIATRIR